MLLYWTKNEYRANTVNQACLMNTYFGLDFNITIPYITFIPTIIITELLLKNRM